MPKLKIPSKLEKFLTTPKRFKVAFGGRGGAKSQSFADILLLKSQTESAKIGCFREMQNSIEDSVHSLLSTEVERLELTGFTAEKATIYNDHGGEFRFKGLSRNPDAVKSMHGFKYFWVEEGQSISADSLKKLTPTLREAGSEMWVSMNPESSEDPMSKRFITPFLPQLLKDGFYEDDQHLIVWINYTDNPWFPEVLEKQRQWDYDNLDRAEYDHIWLGYFNDSVEGSIIKKAWLDACVDAHIKLGFKARGQKVVTHDPGDSGDPRALVARHGSVIEDAQENTTDDVNDSCDWAIDHAIGYNADVFRYDSGGLGLTLKRQVSDALRGKRISWQPFNGAEGPENPEEIYNPVSGDTDSSERTNKHTFKNKRAQMYAILRDRVYLTYRSVLHNEYNDPDKLISFNSKMQCLTKMISELSRIPKKPNGAGLFQIMDKPTMKSKYKIDSPNLGDCVMMQMEEIPDDNADFFKPLPPRTKGIA